jgi:photosystem II stability/assembly factor-like uncharacterized protein
MVPVILASLEATMSILTRPRPPRADAPSDVEALEALIEEARQRARRRRRGYAACTLVAAAAGLLGFYGFNHGGGSTRPQARAEQAPGEAGAPSQKGTGESNLVPGFSLDGAPLTTLAVDPHRPSTIFAATFAGVLRSSDGGHHWDAVNTAPSATRVDSLVIAPTGPETVYAGTGGGVFKSTDGGTTWQAANSGLFGKDTTLEQRNHRLAEGYVYALAVDPRDPETVYAGTLEEGLFKTTNGGASWRSVGLRGVSTLVLDPRDPETIYAGAEGGGPPQIFKSTDGGSSWSAVGLQGKNVKWLSLNPEDTDIVYAGTFEHGVFRSRDGGSSWRAWRDVGGLTFDPQNAETVYANSEGRILKSTDGARTWRGLDVGRAADFLALDPGNSATLYAEADRGLIKSTDAGRSWRGLRGDPFWKALSKTP